MEDATSLCHLLTCALVSTVKNVQPETYSQDSLASMVKAFESKGLHLWMTHVDETWVTWVTWDGLDDEQYADIVAINH